MKNKKNVQILKNKECIYSNIHMYLSKFNLQFFQQDPLESLFHIKLSQKFANLKYLNLTISSIFLNNLKKKCLREHIFLKYHKYF